MGGYTCEWSVCHLHIEHLTKFPFANKFDAGSYVRHHFMVFQITQSDTCFARCLVKDLKAGDDKTHLTRKLGRIMVGASLLKNSLLTAAEYKLGTT